MTIAIASLYILSAGQTISLLQMVTSYTGQWEKSGIKKQKGPNRAGSDGKQGPQGPKKLSSLKSLKFKPKPIP